LVPHRDLIEDETRRVYAPVTRKDGMDWKELNAGLCRVMQNYCGEPKNEELLKIGMLALEDIEKNEASEAHADNPHKLMRTIEVMDILTCDQMIIQACMARRASSRSLSFIRSDYPEMDPPEWQKWITIQLAGNKVKVGELPIDFWGSLEENYKAHCGE
jgi:succinate dehydrogenase/fumarate reductase flavoprotein subunit